MDEQESRHSIIATLQAKGFEQDLGASCLVFSGELAIGHVKVPILMSVPDVSFVKLPEVRIADMSRLPMPKMAHVEQVNRVCFASIEVLRLDPYDPGGSVLRVLEEVKKALETSLNDGLEAEVAKEFPRYWGGVSFLLFSGLPEKITKGALGFSPDFDGNQPLCFAETETTEFSELKQKQPAIWIPVDHEISIKDGIAKPADLQELKIWWKANGLRAHFGWPKTESQLLDHKVLIIASPNAIVGVSLDLSPEVRTLFKNSGRKTYKLKYIDENPEKIDLTRFIGTDCSLNYLGSRNTGLVSDPPLVGKKIALIGCGTIGSHLGRMLVQSGAGNGTDLVLIDDDFVSPGNLGRHLLNCSDVGANKAVALCNELRRFHKDVRVRPIGQRAEYLWDRLRRFDLIVDATGVESLSEFLNLQANKDRALGRTVAILHSYIWQNGIAVQSFLNVGEGQACYRCLKPSTDWVCDPRKDTSELPEVVVARCGDGPFLPYSVSASVSAAGLALEHCFEFFSNKDFKTLRTRILDTHACKSVPDRRVQKSNRCPACGT